MSEDQDNAGQDQGAHRQQEERRHRDRIVERFNRNYSVVDDHGTVWIFKEVTEVDQEMRPGFRNIYRLNAPHFRLLYQNRPLAITEPAPTAKNPHATRTITRSEGEWWLIDRNRRTYQRAAFAPGRKLPADTYQLWRGWAVEPVRPRRGAGWPRMQDHVFNVICSGIEDYYKHLLDWTAYMVQHPGEVGHSAVVLQGGEGIGKTFFAKYLLRMFGPHALHLRDANHLHGRYNIHLQNCILLYSDEAYYPGDKAMEGILRALITEQRLPVEAKYQNLFETNNCIHLLISSNNNWVVPMATDARRFFVLEVPDTHKGDTDYWNALGYELEHGGPSAMLGELLFDRNVTYFNPRQVPDTAAGRRQKRLSLDTINQYLLTALDRGYSYRPDHRVPSMLTWRPFTTMELFWQGYQQSCDDTHRQHRQSREELGEVLSKLFQAGRPQQWHPTHELKRGDISSRRQDDSHQDWLHLDDTNEPLVDADRLPDDLTGAIVCQKHMRGYYTLSLEEARDAFERFHGPLDAAWHLQGR